MGFGIAFDIVHAFLVGGLGVEELAVDEALGDAIGGDLVVELPPLLKGDVGPKDGARDGPHVLAGSCGAEEASAPHSGILSGWVLGTRGRADRVVDGGVVPGAALVA